MVYWLNTTATCMSSTWRFPDAMMAGIFFNRFHNWHTVAGGFFAQS
jgi:hypothetical protein